MAFRNVPTGARRAPGGTFPSRRKMFLRGPDGGKTFHRGPDGGAGRGPGGTFPGRKRRGPTGKHLRGPRAPPRCCSAILRPPRRSSHSLVDSRFPVPTRVLPRPLSWVTICSDCLYGALTPARVRPGARSPRDRGLAGAHNVPPGAPVHRKRCHGGGGGSFPGRHQRVDRARGPGPGNVPTWGWFLCPEMGNVPTGARSLKMFPRGTDCRPKRDPGKTFRCQRAPERRGNISWSKGPPGKQNCYRDRGQEEGNSTGSRRQRHRGPGET